MAVLFGAVVGVEQLFFEMLERQLALDCSVQDQLGGTVEKHQCEPLARLVLTSS